MDWGGPCRAGFAVALVSLSSIDQSRKQGAIRMLGTLVTTLLWPTHSRDGFRAASTELAAEQHATYCKHWGLLSNWQTSWKPFSYQT